MQILHRIAKLFSIDFPDHGEDGFHIVGCVRRYVETVVPCRFCILLSSWSTEELTSCARGCPQALFWATSSPFQYQVSASGLSESSESSSS